MPKKQSVDACLYTCVTICEYGKNNCRTVYTHTPVTMAFCLVRDGGLYTMEFCLGLWFQTVSTAVRNILDVVTRSQNTGIIAAQTYGNIPVQVYANVIIF